MDKFIGEFAIVFAGIMIWRAGQGESEYKSVQMGIITMQNNGGFYPMKQSKKYPYRQRKGIG